MAKYIEMESKEIVRTSSMLGDGKGQVEEKEETEQVLFFTQNQELGTNQWYWAFKFIERGGCL